MRLKVGHAGPSAETSGSLQGVCYQQKLGNLGPADGLDKESGKVSFTFTNA